MAKPATKASAKAAPPPKPAKAAKPAKEAKASGGKGLFGPGNRALLYLTLAALVPFSLPTLLLLFFGMLPTIAAAVGPRRGSRGPWAAVGGLNFAGLSPALVRLWFGHHTFTGALDEIAAITPLLGAYAAAAFGWLLHLSMPPLVGAVVAVTSQKRIAALQALQRKLIEQWGEDVVSRIESE